MSPDEPLGLSEIRFFSQSVAWMIDLLSFHNCWNLLHPMVSGGYIATGFLGTNTSCIFSNQPEA